MMFIGGEPRADQDGNLFAQTIFQRRYVDGGDRLSAAEVAPPLINLLLERNRRRLMAHFALQSILRAKLRKQKRKSRI